MLINKITVTQNDVQNTSGNHKMIYTEATESKIGIRNKI